MKGKIGWALLYAGYMIILLAPSQANDKQKVTGEKVFKQYCARCHTGGGNYINPKRPVAESKELANLMAFKSYLSNPPGHMPYYQNVVSNHATLEALYKYCKGLKKQPNYAASNDIDNAIK